MIGIGWAMAFHSMVINRYSNINPKSKSNAGKINKNSDNSNNNSNDDVTTLVNVN